MDSIDVTSPEFSLGGISELNNVISDTISLGNISSDYAIYIYIGVAILVCIVSYFIYKFFFIREKKVTFQDKLDDCYGDSGQ
jgi:phosphotransferase system  glucose/maltose/N-acetylglucosamine-specific IIC component